MNMLVQAGLEYDVVREELEAQIERLGDDQFATFANEALVELEERYGVTTPIEGHIQELTNRYYRGLEVLQALDEPMTVDELAAELELDAEVVRDRIVYRATGNVNLNCFLTVPNKQGAGCPTMGLVGCRVSPHRHVCRTGHLLAHSIG
jgi:hypothetical protein